MFGAVIRLGKRLVEWVADSPYKRPVYTYAYLISIYIGVITLIAPPRTIEGVTGLTLSSIWAVCFALGGAIGAATIWVGWWWLERIGLLLIGIGGVGVYGVVVLYLQITQAGNRFTQFGIIALASVVVLLRYATIWRYSFQPRPELHPEE